ncbi:MAG: DUF2470 domain-containing protein [Microbacteriaceae bacterium]
MPEFTHDVISAVLTHMNDDHPEDSLLIARAFAHSDATSATMTGLDGDAGYWEYTLGGETLTVSVPWSGPISERPEIRREIVVLYDSACARLGIEPRAH